MRYFIARADHYNLSSPIQNYLKNIEASAKQAETAERHC